MIDISNVDLQKSMIRELWMKGLLIVMRKLVVVWNQIVEWRKVEWRKIEKVVFWRGVVELGCYEGIWDG